MKTFFKLLLALLVMTCCNRQDRLKVVLSKFPNDSIQEVIYYNLPITTDSSGVKEIYFENGKLQAKGNCKNRKRQNKWAYYRNSGELEWRTDYLNDIENGLREVFYNGGWSKTVMIDGFKNGPMTEFTNDPNGAYWIYGQYKNNKREGCWIWKNQDQKMYMKLYYTNGKPDKSYENFYDNGNIKDKAFLRLGYIDSCQTFDSIGKLIKTEYFKDSPRELLNY